MRRFRKGRDSLDGVIHRLIAEKRADGAGGSDLLSSLLATEENGAGMSVSGGVTFLLTPRITQ